MKSLKSLQDLINSVANSKDLLESIGKIMPVHEFKIASSDYNNFVDQLRKSGNEDLIKHVFTTEDYTSGKKADWTTIQRLITEYSNNPEITVDEDLLQVYSRLAVLANNVSNSSSKLSDKLGVGKNLLFGILSSTEAINSLINTTVNYSIKSSETVKETAATFIVDMKAEVNMANQLFSSLEKKAEQIAIDGLYNKVKNSIENIDTSSIAQRFLDKVTEEFMGGRTPAQLASEALSFATTKKNIISQQVKQKLKELNIATNKVDSAVKTAKARKTVLRESDLDDVVSQRQALEDRQLQAQSGAPLKAIINRSLEQAVKNRMAPEGSEKSPRHLVYAGGWGKSYPNEMPKGRFARSVEVVSVTRTTNRERSGPGKAYNILYTYQKYPYATFTKEGNRGLYTYRGRDVQYIIGMAIRDIAKTLITERLNIRPI